MRHPALWLWVSVSLTSSCVIEERKFDKALAAAHAREEANDESDEPESEAGSDEPDVSAECAKYCDRALANCTDENAIYASLEACLGVCKVLPLAPSDKEELSESNTVACRSEQARLAGQTGEPEVHCPAASPGGSPAGRGEGCGNNCESYCRLQPLLCAETDELLLKQDECERRCAALPDRGAFDADKDHDANNVQCRLVHLSSASIDPTAAADHCWHTSITPREGSPCGIPVDQTPDCKQYCDVVTRSCTGDVAVYDDADQCLAACELFDEGSGADRTQDTLGCRLYHSYASLESPTTHCPHAGPAGDGHCGANNCETYCALAQTACPDAFTDGPGTLEACLETCANLPGAARDSGYAAEAAHSGDSVQCRIYHATLAKTDPDECAPVFGAAPCNE